MISCYYKNRTDARGFDETFWQACPKQKPGAGKGSLHRLHETRRSLGGAHRQEELKSKRRKNHGKEDLSPQLPGRSRHDGRCRRSDRLRRFLYRRQHRGFCSRSRRRCELAHHLRLRHSALQGRRRHRHLLPRPVPGCGQGSGSDLRCHQRGGRLRHGGGHGRHEQEAGRLHLPVQPHRRFSGAGGYRHRRVQLHRELHQCVHRGTGPYLHPGCPEPGRPVQELCTQLGKPGGYAG